MPKATLLIAASTCIAVSFACSDAGYSLGGNDAASAGGERASGQGGTSGLSANAGAPTSGATTSGATSNSSNDAESTKSGGTEPSDAGAGGSGTVGGALSVGGAPYVGGAPSGGGGTAGASGATSSGGTVGGAGKAGNGGTAGASAGTGCGNGAIELAEQCDDGNPTSGDGCSSTCHIEIGFGCAGAPSLCSKSPSCVGLAKTCGWSGQEDCCASGMVAGGSFNRLGNAQYPATVSTFRLDNFMITVGRFRKFLAAYSQNMTLDGAGKNPNNPADPGWDAANWNPKLDASASALTSAIAAEPANMLALATWKDTPGDALAESRPMNIINYYQAYAFCIWDDGRLPTHAELNYAASGGAEQRLYPWGNNAPGANTMLAIYGCYYSAAKGSACSSFTAIPPVGSAPDGDGKWGQSDLTGLLLEWTRDWDTHSSLHPAKLLTPCTDCAYFGPSPADVHLLVSGDFKDPEVALRTTQGADSVTPGLRDTILGARCARSAE